jgi:hypothetical protein
LASIKGRDEFNQTQASRSVKGAPREGVALRTIDRSAIRVARLRRSAGVSSLNRSLQDLVSTASFHRCACSIRQLDGESGWAFGRVIRIQISESAAHTRNFTDEWPGRSPGRHTGGRASLVKNHKHDCDFNGRTSTSRDFSIDRARSAVALA